jgi:hypothetical protein
MKDFDVVTGPAPARLRPETPPPEPPRERAAPPLPGNAPASPKHIRPGGQP